MRHPRCDLRRALGGAAVVAAALVAASCGGGEPTTRFHASRVIALGDESSMLVDSGDHNARKYTVNATVSDVDQTILCAQNPLWIQSVALFYGLVFPECNNVVTTTSPVSRIRAQVGAQAADLTAQIDAQQSESPFQEGDMVTVMVGMYDVIAAYEQYPAVSEPELISVVEAAGAETGRQVNHLTDLGPKVLLATVFDMGFTPFGAAERAAHADTDRAALLSRLTFRYNASMRATIVNDGRKIGLILMDEYVTEVGTVPGFGGFTNSTMGVCDLTRSTFVPPSSLDCTAQTLIPGGTSTYFWADDRHLSATGQSVLGTLALNRAQNNPF
ncbi:MAG TPA: esterase [Caldimonas sp.]|jgi:phospholipase/lecithinase/hemolysin|nr:esterase [Caldimonas sp.]